MRKSYVRRVVSELNLRAEIVRSIKNIQHDDTSGKFDSLMVDLVRKTNYTTMSTMADNEMNKLSNLDKSWLVRIWLDICNNNGVLKMNDVFRYTAFTVLEVVRNSELFMSQEAINSVTMLNDLYKSVTGEDDMPEIDAYKKMAILITINLNIGDINV